MYQAKITLYELLGGLKAAYQTRSQLTKFLIRDFEPKEGTQPNAL